MRTPGEWQRHEYRLSATGRALHPTLDALMEWGDTPLAEDAVPPLALRHRQCDTPLDRALDCEEGHRPAPRRPAGGRHSYPMALSR